jgi:ankyrin repeat protein
MRNRLSRNLLGAFLVAGLLAAVSAPDAPLADAAMRGDLERVRALIKAGADVNLAQGDGMTGLHWAAELGDVEMARMLMAAGANVEAVTRIGGIRPLHLAAENGQAAVARALLEAGADARAGRAVTGTTPLHFAARAGSVETIRVLMEHGADVDARELEWEQTPLMFAAEQNRVAAIKVLIEAGADPSLTSKVVEMARRAERDRKAQQIRADVMAAFRARAPDPVTWVPDAAQVQAAARAAAEHDELPAGPVQRIDWEKVQMEGRGLGFPDLVGYQGGLTALLHAVREGNRDAVMALLDGGADVNEPSAGDLTPPLLMAMINGHFDLGLELLARGADPRGASDAGATPLFAVLNTHWAPKARYPQQQAYLQQRATYLEAMETLLEAGADPNARLKKHLWYMEYTFSRLGWDTWGATPFLRAAHALDIDAMKLLVKYGADPNIPTKRPPERRNRGVDAAAGNVDDSGLPPIPVGGPGIYPIHVATGFGGEFVATAANSQRHVPDGWIPAVKYLVEELGLDAAQRDHLGYNAIHHAAGRGNLELVKYLVQKGVDPTVVARDGRSTVDMANGPTSLGAAPFPDVIAYLESLGARKIQPCQYC